MPIHRQAFLAIALFIALLLGMGVSLSSHPVQVSAQAFSTRTPTFTATPLPSPTPTLPAWPSPDLLFTSRGAMHTPILVADNEGRLHLFWKLIEPPNERGEPGRMILYYSQKTATGWSNPVNVLVSNAISYPTAAVDSFGMLHLMWSGENQRLHYTRVPVEKATDIHEWSKPVLFETTNLSAHLVIDRQETLHVVFPGRQAKGIYYMSSTDGGNHWSAVTNVTPTNRLSTSADYPRIAISPNGTIHLVWTEFQLPSGWPPTGIYYTRSEDGSKTWLPKVLLAGPNYVQANIIAPSDDMVHIVWNAIITLQGRFHRWSWDGGNTWSKPAEISSLGGTEGPPQIAADSYRRIHLITTYAGCPNYHDFRNGSWAGPVCLVNLLNPIKNVGWSGYSEEPAFAISNGIHLHAVYWDDRRRLWYSSYDLGDIAEIKPLPFITRVPFTPTVLHTPSASPTIQNTPLPSTPSFQGEISTTNPLRSLFFDLLPALVVIFLGAGAAILLRLRQNHRG